MAVEKNSTSFKGSTVIDFRHGRNLGGSANLP
jgi:hypothetical protein